MSTIFFLIIYTLHKILIATVILTILLSLQDCGHKDTASVIASYGDQIISIQQPDLSEPVIPAKEKKFKGYFKIARHYGWALNKTFMEMAFDQVSIFLHLMVLS